jgi:ketosteroid isomerase-like protein
MGQLRELMDGYYRTMDSKGLDAVSAYWSANCEFAAPGARGSGPDVIRGWIRVFLDASPDAKHTVTTSVEVGDVIALELMAGGSNTRPLRLPTGEIPPTGKAWRLPVCVVIRLRDGVFTSYHIYADMADYLGQIGLTPVAVTA